MQHVKKMSLVLGPAHTINEQTQVMLGSAELPAEAKHEHMNYDEMLFVNQQVCKLVIDAVCDKTE